MSSHYEEMPPITIPISRACRLMGMSKSTIYRRQGVEGFPAIRKETQCNRSYLLYAEVVKWSQSLGRLPS
jgi:predicted DNA-binding transcriptional regulator AlpA